MNYKKTIFKRCISILLVIALLPVGNFVGAKDAYAETTDNALEKNITLSAKLNKEGNIELQWNRNTDASKYILNRNGEELKVIENDMTASSEALYVDKDLEANKEYIYVVIAYSSTDDKLGTCEAVTVSTPEELNVNSDYTLDRDMTVYSLNHTGGTINLNGYTLNICKDYTHSRGNLEVGEGTINCYGNYSSGRYAYINMDNANGKLYVKGNFTWGGYDRTSNFQNGVIEVKDDVTFDNNSRFIASSHNRFVMSGSKKQLLSTTNYTEFNTLEIKNTSDEGVYSIRPLIYTKLVTKKDEEENYKLIICDEAGVEGETLEDDKVIDGEYVLTQGTLDLNGHKLTVKGDLVHIAGDIKINGGELVVEKDYRLESRRKVEVIDEETDEIKYETKYDTSFGKLYMTDEKDKVLIKGNYINNGFFSSRDCLTAGTFEIKGDFTIKSTSHSEAFYSTQNHIIKFTGDSKQSVNIKEGNIYNIRFNEVIYANNSSEGIELVMPMVIYKAVDDTKNSKITGIINIGDNITFADNVYNGDVSIQGEYIAENGMHFKGNVQVNGILRVRSEVQIDGKLSANYNGRVFVHDSQLTVEKDFDFNGRDRYAQIYLENDNSRILVKGNFTFYSYYGFTVEKGVIEIKKNVTMTGGYTGKEANKILLSGSTKQIINTGECILGTLELDNSSDEGVVATGLIKKEKLIRNDTKFTYEGIEGEIGRKLTEDETIDKDFTLVDGVLDLDGHTLTINGNLNQISGDIDINGGELIVKGDYTNAQVSEDSNGKTVYNPSLGQLIMDNEGDKVVVEGNMYYSTTIRNENGFSEGTLEVKKDFTVDNYFSYFYATNNHTLKLSGNSKQTFKLIRNAPEYAYFNNIEITNTSEEGIGYVNSPYIRGNIVDKSEKNSGSIGICGSTKIEKNEYNMEVIINEYIDFTENTKFNKNVSLGTDIRISNDVIVEGNYNQWRGKLEINKNKLTINGNLDINGDYSYGIYMQNEEDYIYVGGDFTYNSYRAPTDALTNGVIEVKGNISSNRGLYSKKPHRFILSGNSKQTIDIASGCKFGILELQNSSEEGVYSKTLITKDELIRNDSKIQYGDMEGEIGWTLTENTTYEGDLVIIDDVLDLNGHTLTITGDMVLTAGIVTINGGKLIVEGDFRQQSRTGEKDSYNYSSGMGRLVMNNSNDKVIVKGNFYQYSTLSGRGDLTDGELEIKGNITVQNTADDNFYPSDNHTVVLSGDGKQVVSFNKNYWNYSQINNLKMTNTSSEGIEFSTTNLIVGKISKDDNVRVVGRIGMGGTTTFKDNCYSGNVLIYDGYLVDEELVINGDVETTTGIEIKDKLTINGNLVISDNGPVTLNNGKLIVNGNMSVYGAYAGVNMTHEEDYILVTGNLIYSPRWSYHYSYNMSNGVFEVKGNLTSTEGFNVKDNHKFILSGDKLQTISLYEGAKFATLELQNYSEEGVYSEKIFDKDTLIRNGCKLTYGIGDSVTGWSLNTDYTCEGDMVLVDDTIDLQGHTLTIRGDLIHTAGKIKVNNGKLVVKGNYIMKNRTGTEGNYSYSASKGELIMTNKDDEVEIYGDYLIQLNNNSLINVFNGTITLYGDIKTDNNISLKDDAKLVMSGSKKQSINMYSPTIAYLINNNDKELSIDRDINITKEAQDTKSSITGNSCIVVDNANKIKDGKWSGNVILGGYSKLEKELVVEGTLHVNGETHVGDNYLYAKDMVINSQLYTDTGNVICNNKMDINKNGLLSMTEKEARVLVGGNFTIDTNVSHKGKLTAGTLEIRGNFTQKGYDYFRATEDHKTILGKKKTLSGNTYIQTITFSNTILLEPGFNILILKKSDDKYQFSHNVLSLCNELIRDVEDDIPPTPVTSIEVKSTNECSVVIEYEGATDDSGVLGYEIYRNNKKIATISDTTYTDKGLNPETQYEYKVYPFDEYSNIAQESPCVAATTLKDTTAPNKPENLEVYTRSGSAITLRWDKAEDNVATKGYRVYRNDELIADNVNKNEYKDKGLEENTVYKYEVEAYDEAGNYSEKSDGLESSVAMPRILDISPKDNSELRGDTAKLTVAYENVGNSIGNTLRIEYLGNNNQWIKIPSNDLGQNMNETGEVLHFEYDWGIKGLLGDKEYIIKYTLTDSDGNQAIEKRTYTVDRKAPELPEDFNVVSENGVAKLSWKASTSSDCDKYNIYLYDSSKDKYTELTTIEGRYNVDYTHKDVEEGKEYTYVITTVDDNGNESNYSDKKMITIDEDKSCPMIEEITPEGGEINDIVKLKVKAKDNKRIAAIKLEYAKKDTEDWNIVDIYDTAGKNDVECKWDTKALEDGKYIIRAYAIDASDNISEKEYLRTYTIDNTGISKIVITSTNIGQNYIQINWQSIEEEDYDHCVVEQRINGEFKEIGIVKETLGFTIGDLQSSTEYTFRVVGYDKLGNRGEESENIIVSTDEDTIAPKIKAVYPEQRSYKDKIELAMDVSDNSGIDYGLFSYSFDNDTYVELDNVEAKDKPKEITLKKELDISSMPEGKLYIKYRVYDIYGNANKKLSSGSDIICVYTIDRTAPKKVSNVLVTGTDGYVGLSWDAIDDVKEYYIYKSAENDGVYKLQDRINTTNWYDTEVEPDKTYSYKICAADKAGNIGKESNEIIVTVDKDTVVPMIKGMSPSNNSIIGKNTIIKIAAIDNNRLSNIVVEYKTDDVWSTLSNIEVFSSEYFGEIKWNTDNLNEKKYSIRAYAIDKAGNRSEYREAVYTIDNKNPQKAELTAESGNYKININIEDTSDTDIAKYEIYRKKLNQDDSAYKKIYTTTKHKYVDEDVITNTMYSYKVKIYDKVGNTTITDAVKSYAKNIDNIKPTASLSKVMTGIEGMEMQFDGLASRDNVRIVEYKWNMGNNDVIYGKRPKYTYKKAGTYIVTLEVKDAAGNKDSANSTVTIKEASDSGKTIVRVCNQNNEGIPFASVCLKSDKQDNMLYRADSNGIVEICEKAGKYRFAAYSAGYMPDDIDIEVSKYEDKNYSIKLEKGEVVVGKVTARKLTLQEMIDAGVDLDDPENYHTFTYTVELKFMQCPIPLIITYNNGDDKLDLKEAIEEIVEKEEDNTTKEIIKEELFDLHWGGYVQVLENKGEGEKPIVAILRDTQSISWLKDMYNVELQIINTAATEYEIVDSMALLELPKGISLAKLENREQSQVVTIGTIKGGESKTTSWIIKGDDSGKYRITVDFEGIMMPFNEKVIGKFSCEEEIEVQTGEGIHVYVIPEESAYLDEEYYIHYAIVNESNREFYNFTTTMNEDVNKGLAQEYILVDPQTGKHSVISSEKGRSNYIAGSNKCDNVIINKYDEKIEIPVFKPGDIITGATRMNIPTNGGEPLKVYYQLVDTIVNVVQGNSLGVEVTVQPMKSHMTKTRIMEIQTGFFFGDPIDISTGAFSDNYDVLSVQGVNKLDYSLSYNSLLTDIKGRIGYGWYSNFDTHIEEEGGQIKYYTTPSTYAYFMNEDTYNGVLYGKIQGDDIILDTTYQPEEVTYVSKSYGMKDYKIVKNSDGTYTVTSPTSSTLKYDTEGRLISMTLDNGNRITLSYNDGQTIIKDIVSDKKLKVNYNENGLVTSVEDEYGRRTIMTYNNDCLISITNPAGETTRYDYDENNRIVSETGNDGVTYVTNTYDEEGRVIRQHNANANDVISLEYTQDEDTGSRTTIAIDEEGNTSKTVMDMQCRVTQRKDANGGVTKFTYDSKGNTTSITDAEGNKTSYTYDENGNMLTQTEPSGAVLKYIYDGNNPITITDALGNKSTMSYNDKNMITKMVDYEGKETIYEYNDDGQLIEEKVEGLGSKKYEYTDGFMTSVTDFNGNKSTMTYDNYGNLTSSIDPEGNKTTYEYDLVGRLLKQTNAEGNSRSYTYNCYGAKLTETDESGNTTTYSYDNNVRLSGLTLADNTTVTYTNNSVGKPTKETYADGTFKKLEYDAIGNVTKQTLSDGTKISYTYDKNNHLTKETTESGRSVSYSYNSEGKITKEIYSDGREYSYAYNKNNQLISKSDKEGNTTKYEYDGMGRVTKVTDALGNTMQNKYDKYGNLVKTIDANGNEYKYSYDANDNCTKVVDPLGNASIYTYDKLNRNTSVSIKKGDKTFTASYVYDKLGRVSKIIDELGNETTMTYDASGNLLTVKDALGNVTQTNKYNKANQLIETTDVQGNVTSYSYDSIGNIIEQVQYLNTEAESRYEFSYDKLNRMTKSVDPLKGISAYEYDQDGNITKQIDPNGGETIYTYDITGKVLSEVNAVGSKKTYTYNALGLLEIAKNARNQETTYTYDAIGRIIKIEDELGETSYTYDANGNILTVKDSKGIIKRTYDELNRVTSYTDYKGNTVKYSYDELGNLISLTYPGGEIVRYEYYDNGYLHKVIDSDGRITVYEYDAVGNLIKTTRPNGTVEERVYDTAYQLVEQIEKDAADKELSHLTYTYDKKGNIIQTEGYKETEEGISKLTSSTMKYDKANRLIEYNGEEVKYDADGNMVYGPIDGKMTELEYDCRNRLIKAGDITYEYDAEGNRIATNTPEYREEYIYDTVSNLPQVLVIKRYDVKDDESTSEEKYKEEVSNTIICYYGNGLLYEDNEKGTYYHHYNNIGSTIFLTNSSGKIVEEYSYGTYGELLSGDISKTKYLYNGQYGIQTEINGLLYMRTRYYNPEVKRFINQDIVLGSITNSQSLNRYAYVQGNPISLVDPFGMSPENGKNAIGHTLLDFMGLIPGIGFVFDAANSAWYVAEGNYTMAALAAFAAIPGLGDAVSAGMLATKGAKAAELCKIIKKLGYAAKVVENVGEFAINATNMYVDYAIKEKEFGVDTVANLLALGLNGFGIYASVKRYNSVSVDVGKVTDGVEGGNKVADKVSESGSNPKNVFPENPDDLLPEIPRNKATKANGTTSQTIQTSDNIRIRAEQHPLLPGETYNPRHHGVHYHVEYKVDPTKSWNNKNNVKKWYPEGYTPGAGSGFIPGEPFPE